MSEPPAVIRLAPTRLLPIEITNELLDEVFPPTFRDEEHKRLFDCAMWLVCEVGNHASYCTCGSCCTAARSEPYICRYLSDAHAKRLAELRARLMKQPWFGA